MPLSSLKEFFLVLRLLGLSAYDFSSFFLFWKEGVSCSVFYEDRRVDSLASSLLPILLTSSLLVEDYGRVDHAL